MVCSFGPGVDSLSTITAWDPPHRFAADSRDDGETCMVRVVHSWVLESDAWDAQYEGHTLPRGRRGSPSASPPPPPRPRRPPTRRRRRLAAGDGQMHESPGAFRAPGLSLVIDCRDR